MAAYITWGFILAIPIMCRIVTASRPFRVKAGTPLTFGRVGHKYGIHTFTGYANDVSKGSSSYTSGSISSNYDGYVSGSVSTTVVIRDQFFLTAADGRVQAFQLNDFNAAVGQGHLVSVAWAIRRHRKRGPYFLVHNHTTHTSYFHTKALNTIAISHPKRASLNLFLIFFWPAALLLFVWGLACRVQLSRFKRKGVLPLVEWLESTNAGQAQRHDLVADDLDRLAAFAQQGLLTSDEWTRAKEQFLGKPADGRSQALSHLGQVYSLYREGALSESEFNNKKWEILARERRG